MTPDRRAIAAIARVVFALLAVFSVGCGDEGSSSTVTPPAASSDASGGGSADGERAGDRAAGKSREAAAPAPAFRPLAPTFELTGHTDGVHAVAFSPDGKRIVTASHDGTARLWDAAAGKPLHVLEGHGGPVFNAAFSDSGEQVATCGADGNILVWDVEGGEIIAMLSGPSSAVYGVAFAPDGSVLGAAQDGTLRRWDVEEESAVWAVRADHYGLLAVAVSPDGTTVATGAGSAAVAVWDLSTGRLKWRRKVPSSEREEAQLLERRQAGGGDAGADDDAEGEAPAANASEAPRAVMSLAFSPDGSGVYSQSFYSAVLKWEAKTGRFVTRYKFDAGSLAADVSPDGQWLLLALRDGFCVWAEGVKGDLTEPHTVATLRPRQYGDAHDVAFSADGRFAALARGGTYREGHKWQAAGPTSVPVWDLSAFKPAAASAPAGAAATSGT